MHLIYRCLRIAAIITCFGSAVTAAIIPAEPNHVVSLDGTWRFKLEQASTLTDTSQARDTRGTPKPIGASAAPEPFYKLDYTENNTWHDFRVPGDWEMAGYSPATYFQPDNTSAYYRKWIDIPKDWAGRTVKVNFDGVQNARRDMAQRPARERHRAELGQAKLPRERLDRLAGRSNAGHQVRRAQPACAPRDKEHQVLRPGLRRLLLPRRHLSSRHPVLRVPRRTSRTSRSRQSSCKATRPRSRSSCDLAARQVESLCRLEGLGTMNAAASGSNCTTNLIVSKPRLWSAEHPNLYDLAVTPQRHRRQRNRACHPPHRYPRDHDQGRSPARERRSGQADRHLPPRCFG